MGVDERLGIQVEFDLSKLDNQLGQIKSKLQNTFGDLSKLIDATKLNDTFKATNTQVEQLRKIWGTTAEDVKKRLKEMYDTEQVEKYVKKSIDQETRLREETRKLQEKQAEDHKRIKASILAETEKAARAELAAETKKGQDIIAIYKRIDAEKRAALNSQIIQGSATVASYKNSGFEPYNNGYIRSGYVRDVAEAHKQALKVVNDAASAQLKIEVKKGQDIAAILRRTTQEEIRIRTEAMQRMNEAQKLGKQQTEAITMNKQFDISKAAYNFNPQTTKWAGDIATQAAQAESYLKNLGKQGFKYVNGEAVAAGNSLGKFSGGLLNLLGLEARFYGVRTALFAISSQVKTGIQDVIKFNQGLYDTAAISNASEASMRKFGEAALFIARNSKEALPEVIKMMNLLAQSGVDAKDVPMVSKAISMFATGTGSSFENAVRVTTTAMNVWNIEAKDSVQVLNTLTAGLNASKLEVNDLSTVFNYLASTASQMGMSIQETTAIIASFSQAGIKASTIGTSVSMLLTRLMAPTPKLRNFLADFGIKDLDEVNPRLHKFADIIDRLKEAKLPTEGIMGNFDQRAGRALQAAINLGSDYFRMMERNVTGSAAMITAYEKSMEGPIAQMNKIRQTFVQVLSDMGNSLKSVLGLGLVTIKGFVDGLDTASGKAIIAIGAIATAVYALSKSWEFFKKANPEVRLILGIVTAVASAIEILGVMKAFDPGTSKITKEYKELVNEASSAQRVFTGLSAIYAKGAEAHGAKAKITAEDRKQLQLLKDTYPQHFKNLGTELNYYNDINTAMDLMNAKNNDRSAKFVKMYNDNLNLLNSKKSEKYWFGMSQYGGGLNSYNDVMSDLDRAEKAANNDAEKLKIYERRLEVQEIFRSKNKAILDNKDKLLAGTGGQYLGNPEDDTPLTPFIINNTKTKPTEGWHPEDKSGAAAEERRDKHIGDAIAAHELAMAKLRVEKEKIDLEDAKLELKNDKDLLKYKLDAKREMYEKFDLDVAEIIIEENKKAAQDVQGTLKFDDKGKMTVVEGGKGYTKEEVEAAVKRAQERINLRINNLNYKTGNDELKIDQTKAPADKLKLNSEFLEKQINRRIELENQDYVIRKDQAKTAEEVRDIDIDHADKLMQFSREKKEAFENDIVRAEEFLYNTNETGDALQTHIDRYEETKNKLVDINRLLEDQIRKQNQLKDISFSGNFGRGVSSARKKFGTNEQITEGFGDSLITTFEANTETAMNKMIESLKKGENAWKSFREGLGDILKGISDELQKYIVKLMAVALAKQIAGIAAGVAETGLSGYGGYASGGEWGSNVSGSSTFSGPTKPMATGGLLVGGIRGKDSIPILGMPNEFMVQESAVKKYGVEFLSQLNEGKVKKLATGGSLGGTVGASSGSIGEGQPFVLNIINVADPSSVPKMTGTEVINTVSFNLGKKDVLYKQIKGILQGN